MTAALKARPTTADARPWSFPRFERGVLSNGMGVIVCHVPERPIIDVRALIGGGARHEQHDELGISLTAGRAVLEETRRHSADDFAEMVESLGATVGAELEWDSHILRLTAPVSKLASALGLFAEALTDPAFRDDDVARLLRSHLGQLHSQRQFPTARAHDAFAAVAFEATGRMAHPAAGTPATVAAVDADRVRRFWRSTTDPSRGTVVVVGDLRGIDAHALLDGALGGWTAPGPVRDLSELPPEVPARGSRVVPVDCGGAVQTELLVGHAMRPVDPADRAALRVATHYLGGFTTSRLGTLLREEKNVTYGVRASVEHRGAAAVFTVSSAVETGATIESIGGVLAEVEALRSGKVDEALFALAVDNLVRTAPIGFNSVGAIAGALVRMEIEGLPDDYFDQVIVGMRETTAAAAAETFARHVRTEDLCVAAAGDMARIGAGLAELGMLVVEATDAG